MGVMFHLKMAFVGGFTATLVLWGRDGLVRWVTLVDWLK